MQTVNNTIVITGGATGIGLAMAEHLLHKNNRIIICARRENKLKEAKQKFPSLEIRKCDLSIEKERIAFAEWVIKNFPETSILINNAGIQQEIDLTNSREIEKIKQEVDINFIAPAHLSSLFIPHLKSKPNAAIINISSGLAFTPMAIMPIYCSTKAALHTFSLTLRHQLSKTGIKVFEIIPPIVDTELDRGARDKRGQTDRGMKPDEFAKLAIEAIRNDTFEAAIGTAANLRSKREELFGMLNR